MHHEKGDSYISALICACYLRLHYLYYLYNGNAYGPVKYAKNFLFMILLWRLVVFFFANFDKFYGLGSFVG